MAPPLAFTSNDAFALLILVGAVLFGLAFTVGLVRLIWRSGARRGPRRPARTPGG